MTAPFTREPVSDRGKPCPYSLMYFSNLMTADNRHIPSDFLGGSKPPPYRVDYKIGKSTEKRPLCLKYEIYSGKSGSIQGEMKEINPSKKVITNSMSVSFVCQSKRDKRYPYPSASIFSKGIKRSAALLIQ